MIQAVVTIMLQLAVQSVSPLQTEAQKVADSPYQVKYELTKQVFVNSTINERQFRNLPVDIQTKSALDAYYLAALKRAAVLYGGNKELAGIIDKFNTDNAREVVSEFELAYKRIYGSWPRVVPVDVDKLLDRILAQQTIR